MLNKKIYVIDSKCSQAHIDSFSVNERRDVEIRASGYLSTQKIPRDHDLYLLHLSDIPLRDLEDLREEQPWSWIFGICNRGGTEILSEVRSCLDGLFSSVLFPSDYNFLLEKVKSERAGDKK